MSLFLMLLLWLASSGHVGANTEMGRMRRKRQRSELDDVAEHTLSESANGTKLGGMADKPKGTLKGWRNGPTRTS